MQLLDTLAVDGCDIRLNVAAEPTTTALLALGLLGLSIAGRRSQIVFGGFRLSDSVTGKSIDVDNRSFLQFDTDGGAITLDDLQLDRFSVISGDITFTGMPANYYCRSSNMKLPGSIASIIKSEHPSCY